MQLICPSVAILKLHLWIIQFTQVYLLKTTVVALRREYINKIFQRFYKTPDSNGFGLGLAMAKTIIKNNNGEISVENGEDGAIFNIKFYKVT